MTKALIVFILLTVLLFLICLELLKKLRDLSFSKRSLSSKYGKTTEQFMPFLKNYPYESSNFRFIGTPIDGIQFEDDKIVFVEFKVGDSRLTAKQEKIKDLINKKKVNWEEFRITV
uniref:Endonuclease n=1 Tax=candidate division CPR3 bacterium TaxID=2268181 RepID=A0A7V3J9T7_UNCC3